MWWVHHHFQGTSLTSQALKTLKVMHFQRITYWERPCMIRRCPHDFITTLALRSTFNSDCKVTEVSGQSVAHRLWPAATWRPGCSTAASTERYCSLLTAAWHCLPRRRALIQADFIEWIEGDVKRLVKYSCGHTWESFGGCGGSFYLRDRRSGERVAALRILSHLGSYHVGFNPQRTEQGLIMIR